MICTFLDSYIFLAAEEIFEDTGDEINQSFKKELILID